MFLLSSRRRGDPGMQEQFYHGATERTGILPQRNSGFLMKYLRIFFLPLRPFPPWRTPGFIAVSFSPFRNAEHEAVYRSAGEIDGKNPCPRPDSGKRCFRGIAERRSVFRKKGHIRQTVPSDSAECAFLSEAPAVPPAP